MPINVNARDIELLWTDPQDDTDQRAPTAPEMAANSRLAHKISQQTGAIALPAGVTSRPSFAAAASRGVTIDSDLAFHAPGHPALKSLGTAVTVNLPALADSVSTISRYDYLQLVVFGVIVTSEIDADIELTFEWTAATGVLQTVSKENTRRIRTAWMIVHSQATIPSAAAIYAALSAPATEGDPRTLTVSSSASGVALLNSLRAYTLDSSLVVGATYEVIEETIQSIPLCRVWRAQEHIQVGYLWGRGGEPSTFTEDYHIQPAYTYVGQGWESWGDRARETFRRIMLGLPLPNSPSYDRAVYNLLNGQVGGNLDAPGIATPSPNGSTALANDQRIIFSNQRVTQKLYCLPVITVDAGGLAQASVPFQSSPAGAFFSQEASDHRVYTVTGRDVTGDGILTGLFTTGALVWTAKNTSIVAPGDKVYVVPGIIYPAGSGFPVAGRCEAIYRNITALNAGNVRDGADDGDINAYTAPANAENYIAVLGRERAALHYLYKKYTVSSDSDGIATIPDTARGIIAFISGSNAPSGRIDLPVVGGLDALASYSLLCYEPPRSTENWQFQFKVPRYKGLDDALDGARILTEPFAYGHTQGGGNHTHLGDGELQYEAIAHRLPVAAGGIKPHSLAHRMQFLNEADLGYGAFRSIDLRPAPGLSLPRAGMVLDVASATDPQPQGLAAILRDEQEIPLGCLKMPLQCGTSWQLVVGCVVVLAGGDRRLLLITSCEGLTAARSAIQFNSDSPGFAGIDTFSIY